MAKFDKPQRIGSSKLGNTGLILSIVALFYYVQIILAHIGVFYDLDFLFYRLLHDVLTDPANELLFVFIYIHLGGALVTAALGFSVAGMLQQTRSKNNAVSGLVISIVAFVPFAIYLLAFNYSAYARLT